MIERFTAGDLKLFEMGYHIVKRMAMSRAIPRGSSD